MNTEQTSKNIFMYINLDYNYILRDLDFKSIWNTDLVFDCYLSYYWIRT